MLLEIDLHGASETEKICGLKTDIAKQKYSDFKYTIGEILHYDVEKFSKKWGNFKEATDDILWHIFNN